MKPLPAKRRPGECVDCFVDPARPRVPRQTDGAPRKPRCATHKRAERKRAKAARHQTYVHTIYGLAPGVYQSILARQGGRCAICQRATGATKRLAVDHDHALARLHDHPEDRGCPDCVRGLCCGPCNDMLAHARSDPEMMLRAARYLQDPPARALRPVS